MVAWWPPIFHTHATKEIYMKFNRHVEQIFDFELFNSILTKAEQFTTVLNMRVERDPNYLVKYSLSDVSYLFAGPKNIELTTKVMGRPTTYIFTLDGTVHNIINGGQAYAQLVKACKKNEWPVIPDLSQDPLLNTYIGRDDDEGKFLNTQAGLLWYNPVFNNKKVYAYSYDINSAYLSCLMKKIPRTDYVKAYRRKVEKDEVGFIFDDRLTLVIAGYADIIFDLVDTPECMKDFASRWYARKKDKSSKYHSKAKTIINAAIGCLQYHNPYLRSYIVSTCNYFIQNLIDPETTVICNTDSIVSTKKLELTVGSEIGEFSLDEGFITINKNNYVADWKTSQRGVNNNTILYKFENGRLSKL